VIGPDTQTAALSSATQHSAIAQLAAVNNSGLATLIGQYEVAFQSTITNP
jgi:hypothetical protein